MKRAYYYLFYKFYKMSEAAPSKWASDWKASVLLTALEIWLLYSLLNYYNVFIDQFFEPAKKIQIFIGVVIALINYYYFIHKDTWKEYIEEFDGLPKIRNRIGGWIVFSIVLIVILNLILSFYLMSKIY